MQGIEGASATEHKDDVTIKSREIDSFSSTPSKRKSKKKSEGASSAQASPSGTPLHTTEASSSSMNIKFILGVALVSIIVGIALGKRY